MTIHHDERATALVGEPLESLDGVRAGQPFRIEGPRVSWAAVELLGSARKARRLTRQEAVTTEGRELAVAGMIDERSRRFSPWASSVADILDDSTLSIAGEQSNGTTSERLTAWSDGSRTLITATEPGADDDLRTLEIVGIESTAPRIASWLAIAPAWAFGDPEPLVIDAGLIDARLRDATVEPPEDAGEFLRFAWSQPWTVWTVAVQPADSAMRCIDAGSAGYLGLMGASDGTMTIEAVPSAAVFSSLVAIIERARRA